MQASALKGLAAASLLVATPVFAQAQTTAQPGTSQTAAQRLSLSSIRTGAPVDRQSRAGGGNWGWIIGGIGLVAGVAYALIEGDDSDEPASP